MIEPVRRHLAIARQFVRMGLVRKSQFRLEFANQVLMDILFYASHLLTFGLLYSLGEGRDIAGWDYWEANLFLGFVFVYDGFMMTWLGQGWHFGADLKKGNLDPVRVRPGHPVVLYFFQRFSPEGLLNLCIGSGVLIWACLGAEVFSQPLILLTLPWAVALAWFSTTIFTVFGSLAEFYFLNSNLGELVNTSIAQFAGRPLDVYSRWLRRFFVYAVPAGAQAYIPACLVLGRISLLEGLAYTLFYLLMGKLTLDFWRYSFRRYESAMG